MYTCVGIHLYLATVLRSGIGTRVRACVRGGCARGRARVGCICLRVQAPLRMHRCVYHAHAGCVRACVVSFCGFGAFEPTSADCRAAGAAAHACGAPQGHLLHEGEGATRVARPVQALGGPVRPTARCARLRRCRRLLFGRVRCRAGRRAASRGVGCGGGGVAGSSAAAEPRARMARFRV